MENRPELGFASLLCFLRYLQSRKDASVIGRYF